jgi:5'-methylthioadenosine phosphorylase
MEPVRIAVIGGSGLYHVPEFTDAQEVTVDTPFGKPSDAIMVGNLAGQRVAFLPRHRRGHVLTPSEVPYRANIYALKTLGVTHIVAVSACGSLREELAPGHIVIPDQLFDFTKDERGRTFFEKGIVSHVGVADPFCPTLSKVAAEACQQIGATVHVGGTFVTIEGPRFSTKGESMIYRNLGFSIIGMTTSPEAFLAREAEIHYTVIAHVTDYDVWHNEPVTSDAVFAQFNQNVRVAQRSIIEVINHIGSENYTCGCDESLKTSIATAREKITPEVVTRLKPIIGKYM